MNATIKEYHNAAGILEGVEIMKEDGTVVVIGDVTQRTQDETGQRTLPEDPSVNNLASRPLARPECESGTDPAHTEAQPQAPIQ